MIMAILAILILSFCLGAFAISYQINGINRAVMATPISIIEKCVVLNQGEEPKINKDQVSELLTYYYDNALSKYTENYWVDYYFYNVNDESYCINDNCSALDITVGAYLMYNYFYKRVMFYQIYRN